MEETDRNILVSTATEYGGKLLEEYIRKNKDGKRKLKVISERLNEEQMKKLIQKESINLIVDASHPYAVNVSNSVIKVTDKMNLKYIRFERKILDYGTENVFQFKSLKELIVFLNKFENKNILSTLGSNSLVELRSIEEKNNLFIRILPTAASIQNAEKLGYLPKNIIAMQGPFSKEMNVAILKNYKID